MIGNVDASTTVEIVKKKKDWIKIYYLFYYEWQLKFAVAEQNGKTICCTKWFLR